MIETIYAAAMRRLSIVLVACALSVPARAQVGSAALTGTVVDQGGAAVPGAAVTITASSTRYARTQITHDDGGYVAQGLAPGDYTVDVVLSGFRPVSRTGIRVATGETVRVDVRLEVGSVAEAISVTTDAPLLRGETSSLGHVADHRKIVDLPLNGRSFVTLAGLLPGVALPPGSSLPRINGGRPRTNEYLFDGISVLQPEPGQVAFFPNIDAIQEFKVESNSPPAEFGRFNGGVINLTTKAGTNVLHGVGFEFLRHQSLNARNYFQRADAHKPPYRRHQFGGTAGGPLVKDRTFFFMSGDYTRQDRTTFLSPSLPSFVLPPDGNLAYTGNYRQALFNARVDHKLSSTQTLMGRFNVDHFYDTNPNDAVGGTSAPSVARRYTRGAITGQGNLTSIVGSHIVNEARLAYLDGDPVTRWEAQDLSTTYTRAGSVPFTIGQSRQTDTFSRQLQLSDTLSWDRGHHTIRLGGSVARHTSGGFGNEPGFATLGTFTFLAATTAPFEQLTLADVQNYTQPISYGITTYNLSQWLIAAYAQDSVRLTNDFTLDLGLRYDNQTLTDAKKDFAPRLGFGWHPKGDPRLAVRGGYGMYYTQIQSNLLADALTGGLDGFTNYTATPGQFGFPTCLNEPCVPLQFDPRTVPPSQLPARNITIRAGQADFYRTQFAQYGLNFDLLPNYPNQLVSPRSQVTSIGAEREIARGLFAGADYVHQHWTDLNRSVDLNAPSVFTRTAPGQVRSVAAANATRPILPVNGGVRSVNVLMNLGVADYDGLQTQVTYRGLSKLYAAVSYTLAKATNTFEPDGNGIGPNESIIARLDETERGPSVLDQRHRAVVTVIYQLPYNISAGTVTQLASSRPFNATTGVDNNGDGANNDRPVVNGAVIGKSTFQGTAWQEVSIFTEGRIRFGGRSVLLRLEGFNLFNHGNILGRAQTIYGDTATPNPTFGQVVAAGTATNALPALANIDPPRTFQFQVRYQF